MITLAHKHIESKMILKADSPLLLFAEDPREFYDLGNNLIAVAEGQESDFSLWDGEKPLEAASRTALMRDYFKIDFSDKKILNLLYKKLKSAFFEGAYMLPLNEINAGIGRLFEDLFSEVDYSLEYSEPNLDDLIKACAVKPAVQYESLLEAIVCYIDLFVRLKNVDAFLFIGLKQVLRDEDLAALYHHCELGKVSLFLLEHQKTRPILPSERAIILTDDLCEIVENFVET